MALPAPLPRPSGRSSDPQPPERLAPALRIALERRHPSCGDLLIAGSCQALANCPLAPACAPPDELAPDRRDDNPTVVPLPPRPDALPHDEPDDPTHPTAALALAAVRTPALVSVPTPATAPLLAPVPSPGLAPVPTPATAPLLAPVPSPGVAPVPAPATASAVVGAVAATPATPPALTAVPTPALVPVPTQATAPAVVGARAAAPALAAVPNPPARGPRHLWAVVRFGRRDDRGQATAEYGLVILVAGLIALGVIAWARGTGTFTDLFESVIDSLTSGF